MVSEKDEMFFQLTIKYVFCDSAEYVGVSGCLLLCGIDPNACSSPPLLSHHLLRCTFAYDFCFFCVVLIRSGVYVDSTSL